MSGADFIQFRTLTKEFEAPDGNAIRVVDPIDLTIREGEFVVFVGPSGCGKTTVMRMVGGLEAPSSGVIYLAGKLVTGPSRDKGMVFQSYSSFPWLTVLGNIRFGMKYRRDISPAEKDRMKFTSLTWTKKNPAKSWPFWPLRKAVFTCVSMKNTVA